MIRNALRERVLLLRVLAGAGRGLLLGIVAMTGIASLMPAVSAIALATLVDRVAGGSGADVLTRALAPLAVFGAALLLGHVLEVVEEPLFFLATARIDGAHRAEVARLAATSPDFAALERQEVRELVWQAKADPVNWTEKTPAQGALTQLKLLAHGIGLVSLSVVLVAFSWWLLPLLLAAVVARTLVSRRQGKRWYDQWLDGVEHGRRAELWADTIFAPAEGKELRVFGFGGWAVDQVTANIRSMFEPVWAVGVRNLSRQLWPLLLVLVPLTIAYVMVAWAGATGAVSAAVATAVFAAGSAMFAYGGDAREVTGALVVVKALERLREELRTPAAGLASPVKISPLPHVRFENVGFSYPGSERKVLDGLDLEIRPGELLAVVGLNGAGKSTLIKLLAGLYTPVSGRITADGTDLRELDPHAWRAHVSVVFQDFVRYDLSAEDNVALGDAGVPLDRAAVDAAARDSGFTEVLDRLPGGWATPLSRERRGGVDLSGGQWQQLVLTRALYALRTGASVLVLDEPTAHLDVGTEFDVFQRLAARRGDASVVLISHRLSTVRQADRIVLLRDGRIGESGTHDELMALGGDYAELFEIQADRFKRGFDDRIEEGELL
ncbi:MAG: ATP-binding cassette domain-containing protein [Saccharothrix sp.]|nr:ATP-binding cassette domain-containing protein [Saccharothrix sp.]